MRTSLVPLAALLLHGASFVELEAGGLDGKRMSTGETPSAYAVVGVSADTSPYAEFEVASIPWSHGQSYRGLDVRDLRAGLSTLGTPVVDG